MTTIGKVIEELEQYPKHYECTGVFISEEGLTVFARPVPEVFINHSGTKADIEFRGDLGPEEGDGPC